MVVGRAVDSSGSPIAGVALSLSVELRDLVFSGQAVTPRTLTTVSDERGGFAFDNVPPGVYQLRAERRTFVTSTVRVAVSQTGVSNLVVRLSPQGVISGRLTDEAGEPAPGVVVRAIQRVFVQGQLQYQIRASSVTTDDRGEYRIAGLAPGIYWLLADKAGMVPSMESAAQFRPTYYPSSLDLAGAAALRVDPGNEVRADIRLRSERGVSIRGKVRSATGNAPAGAVVILLRPDPMPAPAPVPVRGRDNSAPGLPFLAAVRTDAEGAFLLTGVPSGRHRLAAFGGNGVSLTLASSARVAFTPLAAGTEDDGATGFATVTVQDREISDVRIDLRPGALITRILRVEGSSLEEYERDRLRLSGIKTGEASAIGQTMPAVVLISEDGISAGSTFSTRTANSSTQRVSPGRYRVEIPSLPPDLYVKRVLFGGLDVRSQWIEVGAQPADLEIVLDRDTGRVAGRSINARGETVSGAVIALWPRTEDWSKPAGGAMTVRTAQDGSFTLLGVPPGEYLLTAFEYVPEEGIELYAPFLARFNGQAERVKVGPRVEVTAAPPLISRAAAERAAAELPR
jgi:hypothetical protein